ncbi:hypothetical protein [Streptomyces sp. CB03234]|uniref:hypothetical protein n=1 Tax=Streptomyces sp. (strain CB03234) TaxID=1703937 RepID=UPI001F51EE09|nr:hypothetical protein [Streptomyces sp. CB03234]
MDVRSVATSSAPRKRTTTKSTKTTNKQSAAQPRKESAPAPAQAQSQTQDQGSPGGRTVSFTVPSLDRVANGAANAALLPVAAARQVLPAKGGLPLYLGLGVLGAADVIEWPVAIGIGVGYAVLRRGGLMTGAPRPRATA